MCSKTARYGPSGSRNKVFCYLHRLPGYVLIDSSSEATCAVFPRPITRLQRSGVGGIQGDAKQHATWLPPPRTALPPPLRSCTLCGSLRVTHGVPEIAAPIPENSEREGGVMEGGRAEMAADDACVEHREPREPLGVQQEWRWRELFCLTCVQHAVAPDLRLLRLASPHLRYSPPHPAASASGLVLCS